MAAETIRLTMSQALVRYLIAQQMDVYVIQVLSAEEVDPDVKGDLKLVDCEDQDIAEITASAPLIQRYKQTLAAFTGSARDFCTRRGMNYLLATNQQISRLFVETQGN